MYRRSIVDPVFPSCRKTQRVAFGSTAHVRVSIALFPLIDPKSGQPRSDAYTVGPGHEPTFRRDPKLLAPHKLHQGHRPQIARLFLHRPSRPLAWRGSMSLPPPIEAEMPTGSELIRLSRLQLVLYRQ